MQEVVLLVHHRGKRGTPRVRKKRATAVRTRTQTNSRSKFFLAFRHTRIIPAQLFAAFDLGVGINSYRKLPLVRNYRGLTIPRARM